MCELVERVQRYVGRPPEPPPTKGPLRILRRDPAASPPAAAAEAVCGEPLPTLAGDAHREAEYQQARTRILGAAADSQLEEGAAREAPKVIAPEYKAPEPFKGWKVDAAEFNPAGPLPGAALPRPIFTKPIINFEAIQMPAHILIIRTHGPAGTSLQPFFERLAAGLGTHWEVRTQPTHRDALLICQSAAQAEQALNGPECRLSGFEVLVWRPKFFAEP